MCRETETEAEDAEEELECSCCESVGDTCPACGLCSECEGPFCHGCCAAEDFEDNLDEFGDLRTEECDMCFRDVDDCQCFHW